MPLSCEMEGPCDLCDPYKACLLRSKATYSCASMCSLGVLKALRIPAGDGCLFPSFLLSSFHNQNNWVKELLTPGESAFVYFLLCFFHCDRDGGKRLSATPSCEGHPALLCRRWRQTIFYGGHEALNISPQKKFSITHSFDYALHRHFKSKTALLF